MELVSEIGLVKFKDKRYRMAIYICPQCKKEFITRVQSVKAGRTTKCLNCKNKNKYGLSKSRLYSIFRGMQKRIFYEKSISYKNYGGRGITICEEWKNDFMAFYNWAILNGYDDSLTIDRINNDGNYEPSNCRWATKKQQSENKRPRIKKL